MAGKTGPSDTTTTTLKTPPTARVWNGDSSKDQVTAEEWIDQIQNAKDQLNLDDAATIFNVQKLMRGNALAWFNIWMQGNGNTAATWKNFSEAFLAEYSEEELDDSPPSSGFVNLTDMNQAENEKVEDFYKRVVKAVDDLESLAPRGQFELPKEVYPRALTSIEAFAAINAKNKRNAALRLFRHGIKSAFNFVGLNLFIAGTNPFIQSQLLESRPRTLHSALLRAQEIEKVEKEMKESKNLGRVEDDDDDTDNSSDNADNNSFDSMDEDYDDNSTEVPSNEIIPDIGLTESELKAYPTKKLNNLLKKLKIDSERIKDLKLRRRTLKNRNYAAKSRDKRCDEEQTIRREIRILEAKTGKMREIFEKAKQNCTTLETVLKSYGYCDEQIEKFKLGNFTALPSECNLDDIPLLTPIKRQRKR